MNHFAPSETTSKPERHSRFSAEGCSPNSVSEQTTADQVLTGPKFAQPKDSFYRRQILKRFSGLTGGNVSVTEGQSKLEMGESTESDLCASVSVHHDDFYKRIFWGGTIGSAEAYMDGQWSTNDLTSLIRIMIRNLGRFSKLEKGFAWLKNRFYFLQHIFNRNSIEGSRRNIHDHYDLGNDFYQLFLDPSMNYSSGVFASPIQEAEDADLMHEASLRKMDMICQSLDLQQGDEVLEIGTGWGGLAMHMAKNYGCQVTTTTISKEQHALATERIQEAGLSNRITVLLKDYRELTGEFDKIVSIEMIEAVGHQYYDEYFKTCNELLKSNGRLFLQAITMSEQYFADHVRKVDFIRRYVFPGGCLPSITALASSVARTSDMRMTHQLDITPHYVKTLAYWNRQFSSKLEQVRELGFDEKFIRLWHFYLCYCEAAFAERRVHCVHLMFGKPQS